MGKPVEGAVLGWRITERAGPAGGGVEVKIPTGRSLLGAVSRGGA